MEPARPDPNTLERRLYRENLWLRELLTTVAQELERVACAQPPGARAPLLARAMRVRRRLWEGPGDAAS